jgi:mRNA interferase MazF
MSVMRGEVWLANFDGAVGCELQGDHPVVIIQNDVGNAHSPTTIIAPITSAYKRIYITQVRVPAGTANLKKDSEILLNQIRTLDKTRLKFKIGTFESETMKAINFAIKFSLGVD